MMWRHGINYIFPTLFILYMFLCKMDYSSSGPSLRSVVSKISHQEGRQNYLTSKLFMPLYSYTGELFFYFSIINPYFYWHRYITSVSQSNSLFFRDELGKNMKPGYVFQRHVLLVSISTFHAPALTAGGPMCSQWHLDEVPTMAASHLGPLTPGPVLPWLSSPQLLSAITAYRHHISEKLKNIKVRTR